MVAASRSDITLEEPDVARWYLAGDVTANDIREIYAVQMKFCEGKPYLFVLVNVHEIRSMSADARKIAAEGPAPGKAVMPVRASAIVGASFHFRIVGTLVAKAAKLLNRAGENPTRFFDDDAEARLWFAERRRELESSLPDITERDEMKHK
jgi:hypothetical protein